MENHPGRSLAAQALGTEEVFAALWQRRTQALLIDPERARPGFRCTKCGRLQSTGETCVECGSQTSEVGDIFQEAIHDAVEQSAQVRYWNSPQLKQSDSIAALKRF